MESAATAATAAAAPASPSMSFTGPVIFFTPFYPLYLFGQSNYLRGRAEGLQSVGQLKPLEEGKRNAQLDGAFFGFIVTAAKVVLYVVAASFIPTASIGIFGMSLKAWGFIDLAAHGAASLFSAVNYYFTPKPATT